MKLQDIKYPESFSVPEHMIHTPLEGVRELLSHVVDDLKKGKETSIWESGDCMVQGSVDEDGDFEIEVLRLESRVDNYDNE